jgi:uncharacterized protein YggL (DUF469 family)
MERKERERERERRRRRRRKKLVYYNFRDSGFLIQGFLPTACNE